jgi:hypothetical protein
MKASVCVSRHASMQVPGHSRWFRSVVAALLMLLFFSLTSPLQVSADQYYDIRHYDVRMQVGTDNVYHLTETLDVFFKSPRHGIFRTIPMDLYGYRHEIRDIDVINPDTGRPHPYATSREGDMLSIRIGDADVYVEGVVRYQISYSYVAGDDRNRKADEVYFNLIGTEWDARIEAATLRVEMPLPFDATELFFYTGSQGSTDQSRVSWTVSGNVIEAATNEPLGAYEGVTLQVLLEEGYFSDVAMFEVWPHTLAALGLHLAAFGLALYGMIRDANGHRIVPVLSFRPPENLNPAEAAYVYRDEKVQNNQLATLIIHWAAVGAIRIEQVNLLPFGGRLLSRNSLVFHQTGQLPANTPAYERKLFRAFWSHGSGGMVKTGDLSESFYRNLEEATKGVRDRFTKEREILVNRFQSRTRWGILGQLVLTVLCLSLVANRVLGGGVFWGALIASSVLIALSSLAIYLIIHLLRSGKGVSGVAGAVGICVFFLIFVSIPASDILSTELPLLLRPDMLPLLGVAALCVATVLILIWTKVYTPYALQLVSQIRGFRNFLATARKDRLEMMFHQEPSWFYDMLPYAMVFGLTGIWEHHMRTLSMPPPNWYNSTDGFSTYHFTRSLQSVVRTAVSTPSGSSGGSGGGGGSSGGGGGGGGGGSW